MSRRSRKLAVILHADVVGSTELVRHDEALAHERIKSAFERLATATEAYGGTAHEIRGDALVAEFERASDAVCAALHFQAKNTLFNNTLSDPVKPELRIGIALGEVIIDDHTLTGEGVVLAQRLEQLAGSGTVCIQGSIYEAVPQRLPFDYEDLGEQEVKGFPKPVRAYTVNQKPGETIPEPERRAEAVVKLTGRSRTHHIAGALLASAIVIGVVAWLLPEQLSDDATPIEKTVLPSADKPSIAVLPFTNMSGDPDQQYFADGISEDLTTDLSKLSGLFVVARNASFAFRGKSLDLSRVSKELGVRYLLEGSVRRSGEQVRINAQLIDGSTGGHIWAERFDGSMANIFELQDNVNRKIVEALAINLTLAEEEQLQKIETVSSSAYDILLQGLELFHRSSPEAVLEARRLFEKAIELDPDYARAYANVALTHASEVNFAWYNDREEAIRLGLEYADKAMELDPGIPQIYFTRSALYLAQRKYDAAIEAGRRTVEVHPNYADGYGMLAFALLWAGEFPEALETIRKVKQVDPQVSYLDLALEARTLFFMKRYDEAVSLIEESVERNSTFDRTQLLLAAIYAQLGRLDDAAWAVDEALAINPEVSLEYEQRKAYYRKPEDVKHYIESLRMAGVPER